MLLISLALAASWEEAPVDEWTPEQWSAAAEELPAAIEAHRVLLERQQGSMMMMPGPAGPEQVESLEAWWSEVDQAADRAEMWTYLEADILSEGPDHATSEQLTALEQGLEASSELQPTLIAHQLDVGDAYLAALELTPDAGGRRIRLAGELLVLMAETEQPRCELLDRVMKEHMQVASVPDAAALALTACANDEEVSATARAYLAAGEESGVLVTYGDQVWSSSGDEDDEDDDVDDGKKRRRKR